MVRAFTLFIVLLAPWVLHAERVIFLHLNDEHGHFYGNKKGQNSFAQLATWVEYYRHQASLRGASVIVTFGGDMNTGTPESNLLKAAPDLELFNTIGLDIAVLGNHEFDHSVEVLQEQIRNSKFPWVSANVSLKSGAELVAPYKIVTRDGVRVAFLGLTTRESEIIVNPAVVDKIKFARVIPIAQKLVPQLKSKADFVVALTHLGYRPQLTNPEYAGEIELAKEVEGIDLILGGHSHTLVEGKKVNGVSIFQGKSYNEYLMAVEFDINRGKPAKLIEQKTIKLDNYPPGYNDSSKNDAWSRHLRGVGKVVKLRIKNYMRQTEKAMSARVGSSAFEFAYSRDTLYVHSTPLGNLIADSHRAMVKADVAIMNAGGIRSKLPKGAITLRDILTVSPFNNTIGTVKVTGKELKKILSDKLVGHKRNSAFPHVSGMTVVVHRSTGKLEISIQGAPLDKAKKYSLATNSFVANGGSGYPNFVENGGRFNDSGFSDAYALETYIKTNAPLKGAQWQRKRIEFK